MLIKLKLLSFIKNQILFTSLSMVLLINPFYTSISAERPANNIPFDIEIFPPLSTSSIISNSDSLRHNISIGLFWSDAYSIEGIQLANVVSSADKMKGLQLSCGTAISNIADGAQISLLANITNNIEGLQLSIINYADSVNGLQFGLLNLSDANEGISIGLISYVKEAGLGSDLWLDETGFVNIGLRTGTKNFHNILSYGYGLLSNSKANILASLSYTIGGDFYLTNNYFFITDFMISAIWDQNLSSGSGVYTVYKLRTLLGIILSNEISIFFGPTYNYLVAGQTKDTDFVPLQLDCTVSEGKQYVSWIGFVLGLRY